MDAEAKGLTVEDLTLGQAPSPEALVARFVGEGILHLAEDGTLRDLDANRGVMGYHRPVSAFNPGKQAEHRERRHFVESACPRDLCE